MNIRIASVLTALLLTACALVPQKPQPAIAEAQPSTPVLAKDYRIGVDDLVQISVWDNPELSVTVPVRPDGKISVPIIGDVQVGELTSQEAAASIRDRLSVYTRLLRLTEPRLPSCPYHSQGVLLGAQTLTPASWLVDSFLNKGG
jgi:polysaccharide export outer membrane protein